MSDGVIKILDKLGEKFGLAIDWSSQNIIPYLQELMGRYVSLCNAKAITWIVVCSVLLILLIIGLYKMIKWAKTEEGFKEDEIWMPTIALLSFVIIIILGILVSLLFKIYANIFTPELVFLDYIKSMCGGI